MFKVEGKMDFKQNFIKLALKLCMYKPDKTKNFI